MKRNLLCELLGIEYPVIQAPMNWITGAELAGAVSAAGGLGVIGPNAGEETQTNDVVETGERLRRQIRKVKYVTDKPFAVNLMTFFADHADSSKAFSDQCLQVILEERVPIAVLAGSAPKEYTERLKREHVKVLFRPLRPNIVTAREAEEAGVDVLIAVGFEAGGHAGYDRIPTLVLIPQIVDAVQIPVVAGGGFVDGRGMAAALALGAQGIFMGTRFVATTECSAHQNVKNAILDATDTSTVTVTGTVGVLRALKGPLMERCIRLEASGGSLQEMSNLYRPGYAIGMVQGDMNEGTFVCGAGAGLIKEIKGAAEVVRDVVREAEQIIDRLQIEQTNVPQGNTEFLSTRKVFIGKLKTGDKRVAETKYGKYVVTDPVPHPKVQPHLAHHVNRRDKGYVEGWMRPGEGRYLPQENLSKCGMRVMVARQLGLPDPQPFLDAHKHGADEVIMFLSTTPDGKLGATVDIEMGEEGEHHIFDETTIVYAPKGLIHGPIWYNDFEEGRTFYLITIMLQAEYD